jgi:hypothetical protein
MNQAAGADGGFLVPPEFAHVDLGRPEPEPENLLTRMTDQYTVRASR